MKISVLITSYNQEQYLAEAIDSVLAQTLRPHQIIVVDDCSQDDSRALIAGYVERFPDLVQAVYLGQNQGVARARAAGLRAVLGSHATYVDGDDRFLPAKLEMEARALAGDPRAQIAYSNDYYMDARGNRTGVWFDRTRDPVKSLPQGDVFCETFGRQFPKRKLFRMELVEFQAWRQVGFHDPTLRIYEDWDMRIRLTRNCRVVYCDEPLAEVRIHRTGLSATGAAEHLAALDYLEHKHAPLLSGLARDRRQMIQRGLRTWRARLMRRAARETMRDEGLAARRRAAGLYLQSLRYEPWPPHARTLARILLPAGAYSALLRKRTAVLSKGR